MHADTNRNASREKRVSMISPTTVELVASGAKKINACVEMTAACLTGRIAAMWSSRLRVPAGGVETAVTRGSMVSSKSLEFRDRSAHSSLQTLVHDDGDGVTEQLALLDLPRGVGGELDDDGEGGRATSTHEGVDEFLANLRRYAVDLLEGSRGRDVLQLHEGDRHLAEDLVGYPDHGRADDAGHAEDDVLDLSREDLLASPIEHVVAPSDEKEIVVGVEITEVASAQPSFGVEPVFVANAFVTLDHRPATDLDVSGMLRVDERIGRRRNDAQLHPDRGTDGTHLPRTAQWVGADLTRRFGHAVGLDDNDVRVRLEGLQQRSGQRRRGRTNETDPRGHCLVAVARDEPRNDRGYGIDPGHFEAVHQRPETSSVKSVVEDE